VDRNDFLRTLQKAAKQLAKKNLTQFSMNDFHYWDARMYQPRYDGAKSTKEAATFAVRIQAHGERRNVALPDMV
jgi:hypothetical protein